MSFGHLTGSRYAIVWSVLVLVGHVKVRSATATNGWPDEQRQGPFHVHADFSLRAHAYLLAETAQLQRDLATTLGLRETEEPIHLFFFARQATYQEYLQRHFPGVPYRRALYIKRRGPGMVFAHLNGEFEVDVRHESTHALLHASLPHLPLWLDEGLAEYFEVSAAQRAVDNPHLTSLRRELRLGSPHQIDELDHIADLDQMGSSQYRYAWSWVHFMLHGPPAAQEELLSYLADIQAAVPAGQLSERLRRRLPDLDRRYLDHFRHWGR